ncbi:MAG: LysM peptidoglycan-binding domain-containing M23 family metallopeptidase [Sphingomonadaceae bacterium]
MTYKAFLAGIAFISLSAAAQAASPEEETVHVVGEGETLNGIANRAGVPRQRIIEANGLDAPYMIRVGQKLEIPRGKTARRTIASRASTSKSSGLSTYVVKSGETLGGIANREGVPRVSIIEANGLKDPYVIRVGQKLLIPRTRHHTVKDGETGFAIAMDYGVPWKNIAIANGLDQDGSLQKGQKLLIPAIFDPPSSQPETTNKPTGARFAWPLTGDIRRKFTARGAGDYHDGIDIVADKGAAARSIAEGTVIFAQKEPRQFGNLVIIDHGNGYHSAYGSLEKLTVKKGDKVGKGERVGLVGDTSITRKTELHFELRKNGKPVDPLTELP